MRPRAQEAAKRSSANRKGRAAGGKKGGKGRLRCQLPPGPASGLSLRPLVVLSAWGVG